MDAARPGGLSDVRFAERLRSAGLRLTRPRQAVYAALRRMRGHRSADEILAELRRKGIALPRQSAYNALASLHQAGLLLQADAGAGRALYETRTVWHHHFVCSRCGRIVDTPCVRGRKPCLQVSPAVGRANEAQIIFRGLCRSCRRR